MTNTKIYRLAQRFLSDFQNPPKTPNDVYNVLVAEKNLADYYRHMGPDNFIKLCIATWGLSQDMNQQQIEGMYDKVFFATVFYTEGESFYDTCNYCDGDGREECNYCSGTGKVTCDECDGDAYVECDDCGGDGKVEGDDGSEECGACDGEGRVQCGECGGRESVDCSECEGHGDVYCNECDGDGQIETDELVFKVDFIVSWSPSLYQRCEIKEDEVEEVMSVNQFYGGKSLIILGEDSEEHAELMDRVQRDEIYCLGLYNKLPRVAFNPNSPKFFSTPQWDINHLKT